MWQQLRMIFRTLLKGKAPVVAVQDIKLKELIERKTGVIINKFLIPQYERSFGAMFGIPGNPQLYLSKGLYERFAPEEIEYVVLHEVGHYVLKHTLIEAVALFILAIIGCFLLHGFVGFNGVAVAVILGFIFGITMVYFTRLKEYQADKYAVTRVGDPKGMITATEKFRFIYKDGNSIRKQISMLFFRGTPYQKRIQIAKEEIEKRRSNTNKVIV